MFLLLNQPLLLLYFTVTKVNKNQYKKQLTLSSPKDVPYVYNNFGVQRQRSPTYKEKWSSNYPPIMKWNRTLLMWWTCTHGIITLIERPTTSHALLMSSESQNKASWAEWVEVWLWVYVHIQMFAIFLGYRGIFHMSLCSLRVVEYNEIKREKL